MSNERVQPFASGSFGQRFWEVITGSVRRELRAAGTVTSRPAGTVLFLEGDLSATVLVILRGSVKVITISADGHERLLAVRGPGEIIGEISAVWRVPRSATVQATAEVEILSIPDRAFIRVLRHFPATMMELFRISGERRRDADLERAEYSGLPVARRIASVLVKLAAHRHAQDDGTIPLPLTQDDLASLAGTSRSSVARALATLRAEDVLVTAPRQIILVDPERLRSNIGGVSSDTAPAKEIR